MKILLFGASGMVGHGVLRECRLNPDVTRVVAVARTPIGALDSKFNEIILADLTDIESVSGELQGFDACLFCLGVSALGLTESQYAQVTYDLTLKIANLLVQLNRAMTFIYVSGAGTDGTEKSRIMWARVKGKTENALLGLPFKAVFLFRPGFIVPLHGIRSKVGWYRAIYALTTPIFPLLRRVFPNIVTTTEILGRAMLRVAADGYSKAIVENSDINLIGATTLGAARTGVN